MNQASELSNAAISAISFHLTVLAMASTYVFTYFACRRAVQKAVDKIASAPESEFSGLAPWIPLMADDIKRYE